MADLIWAVEKESYEWSKTSAPVHQPQGVYGYLSLYAAMVRNNIFQQCHQHDTENLITIGEPTYVALPPSAHVALPPSASGSITFLTFGTYVFPASGVTISSVCATPMDVKTLTKWGCKEWFGSLADMSSRAKWDVAVLSNPTRQAAIAMNTLSLVEMQISKLEYNYKISFAPTLMHELNSLVDDSKDDYPDQEPMSLESLKDFIEFLELTPELSCPEIVLAPSGNIRAEWHKDNNHHFAVQFLGDNDVQYVIFAPDQNHPDKINRTSSRNTTMSLMKSAASYNVLSWASDCMEIT